MAEPRKPTTTPTQKKPPSKASASALSSPSRRALKSFFSCRYNKDASATAAEDSRNKCKRVRCTGSLCNVTPTTAAADISKRRASISGCKAQAPAASPLGETSHNNAVAKSSSMSSSSSSAGGGSFRVMHLRRLSGCYECHMVVDPINGVSRDSSCRATIYSTCADCSEIFANAESLELHQSIRHAVSELGPEDTSRNIVEIIFQSSWLKKQTPVCKIDRILKIHNTKKTIASFEAYRDSIKSKAGKLAKKHPRCAADGNELLRFHCTTFTCSLGLDGATSLCDSIPRCKMCSIIRDGMKVDGSGRIRTLATSGRAHDSVGASPPPSEGERRAMVVCRVIAGRVGRRLLQDAVEECDSVAAGGVTGGVMYSSNLDELFVFNPKAILPCFVVIYRDF